MKADRNNDLYSPVPKIMVSVMIAGIILCVFSQYYIAESDRGGCCLLQLQLG